MDVKKVKKTMKVGPKKGKVLYGLQWVNYGNVSSSALLKEVESAGTFSDSDADALVKEFANEEVKIAGVRSNAINALVKVRHLYYAFPTKHLFKNEFTEGLKHGL